MNVSTRFLLLLTVLLLAACGGRSGGDDPAGDVAGGDTAAIDVWWDDTDAGGGDDVLGDMEPPQDLLEDGTPVDVLEDAEPHPDDLVDTLEDLIEDSLEDSADVPDTTEDGGDVDEDVIDPPPGKVLEITECGALPAAPEGGCVVQEGSAVVVLRGTVLAPWEVFVGGEILISSGGDIGCVGCDCSGDPEYAGATVITCPDGIVSPGLINAHDHITYNGNFPGDWGTERFDHRHDWRCGIRGHNEASYSKADLQTQVIWAELRHVLGGATSVAGSGSAPGFLRNLDRANWMEGLDVGAADNNTFPLGDSGCTLKATGCNYPNIEGAWVLDNNCYLPHVAEGIDVETRNEFLCLSSSDNGGVDLTEDNSAFIHGVGVTAVDVALMGAEGTALIWSPRSNISLYGHTAQVTMYHTLGVRIGLGTDWTLSGSINVQRELACAASLNDDHFGGFFTDHELWLMATTWNAQALNMETAFGSLEPGLVGDVAIFQGSGGDAWHRDIIDGNPSGVHLVLRGGVPLYGDLDLVAALSGGGAGCEALPAPECLIGKAVCIEAETGETYVSLLPTNASHYPLAFCGVPDGEVTCVPYRENEFDGSITAGDLDGDGVANADDNCPSIFNPGRPLDGMVQPDHDQDGVGDVCDVCPLQADTEECEPPDPDDKDADTISNADDNCPQVYNPDQADLDLDGKGDACDLCASISNPGDAPCPATIYDVKTGVQPAGADVALGGVVTAVAAPRFWVQVPEADHDPVHGFKYSGVYVYVPAANPGSIPIPEVGDVVTFTASVKEWNGQIQLDWVANVEILASDVELPAPVVVAPQDVATGGPDGEAYEGVLVRVEEQPVTALLPDFGEYVLADSLIVDDGIWLTQPFPLVGDELTITGPLMWTFNDYKLEPRGPQDVIEGMGLATFGPSPIHVLGGDGPTTASPEVTLTLPAPAGGLVLEFLSTNQDVYADGVVFIPEGETSATLDLSTPWIPVALEAVTVSVAYEDKLLTVEVIVIPPDYVPVPVAFDPPAVAAVLGEETLVALTLDVPVLNAFDTVELEILGDPVASVPPTVTLAPGEQTVQVPVMGLEVGTAQVRAFTAAGELVAPLEVLDVPSVGLIITEVLYDVPSGDSGYEWVEVFNGTTGVIDLAGYSLGNGGSGYTASWQLAGILSPGQCAVIGGPLSDETNASPAYAMELDFEPDLQNSGATADGVALFPVPLSQLTGTTVPIDAVIYGGANDNGLWDESGGPGEVDVGDANSGSSISRVLDGWQVTPDPTPNDCSHAF